MSYIFFSDILEVLGQKLNYEAVVNYAGNSFCEKSWEMIEENNPMKYDESGTRKSRAANNSLISLFESGAVKIGKPQMKGVKDNGKG